MRSPFAHAAAALATLALALGAHGFVAFSGNACNGAVGGDVFCDGTCFPFGGRQSFIVRLAFSGPSAPEH